MLGSKYVGERALLLKSIKFLKTGFYTASGKIVWLFVLAVLFCTFSGCSNSQQHGLNLEMNFEHPKGHVVIPLSNEKLLITDCIYNYLPNQKDIMDTSTLKYCQWYGRRDEPFDIRNLKFTKLVDLETLNKAKVTHEIQHKIIGSKYDISKQVVKASSPPFESVFPIHNQPINVYWGYATALVRNTNTGEIIQVHRGTDLSIYGRIRWRVA